MAQVSDLGSLYPVQRTGNADNERQQINKLFARVVDLIPAGGATGPSGNVVWGNVTGLITDQSDLQAALVAKLDTDAVKNSIELDSGSIQLVGDAASPGNGKFYGTSTSGTRGWHDFGDYVQSEGGFRLNRTTSAQSITSTTYATVTNSNWISLSESGDIEYTVWLRFPTASTSGTLLFNAATSLGSPDLSLINAVSLDDKATVTVNDASDEVTVSVKSTGSANTIAMLKLIVRAEASTVVQWALQCKKGTITNNFEIYRLSYSGRIS